MMNEEVISNVGIGVATFAINTPDCLGHPLIWPCKDEIIDTLIRQLSDSFESAHSKGIKFDIVSVEPGSIIVKVTLLAGILSIATQAISIGKDIYELADYGSSTHEQVSSVISLHTTQCKDVEHLNVSNLVFAKRGLCYGPVAQGDTLTSIAIRMNPKGVTVNQVLMALFKYNPESFHDGNINNLREKVYLSLPKSPNYMSKLQANKHVEFHNDLAKK
jgi:FimV-like protein